MKYEKSHNKDLNFIYRYCCESIGLKLSTKIQTAKYVRARLIYYKVARENTLCSLGEIGSLTKTDPATVKYSLSKFDPDIINDEVYFEIYFKINTICEAITEGGPIIDMDGHDKKILNLVTENSKLRTEIEFLKIDVQKGLQNDDVFENRLLSEFRALPLNKKMDVISKIKTTRKVYEKFRDSQKDVRRRDSGIQREVRQ